MAIYMHTPIPTSDPILSCIRNVTVSYLSVNHKDVVISRPTHDCMTHQICVQQILHFLFCVGIHL